MALWESFPGAQHLRVQGGSNFDTGIGVHCSAEDGGYSEESIRQAHSLGVRWAVLLSLGKELGDARSETIQLMLLNGIYPISRIYRDTGWMSISSERAGVHTGALRRNFTEAGYPNLKPYVQVLNEPNLIEEWNDPGKHDQIPDGAPELIAERWYGAAQAVLAAGGIPITTPLSPGGVYNDWVFFVRFVRRLKDLAASYPGGAKAFLEQCAIGIHNYTDNKPLDWGLGSYRKWALHDFRRPDWHPGTFVPDYEDNQSFCMWQWYHDCVLDVTGADCSVMSCEGGTYPGNSGIHNRPKIDAGLHASYTTSQMALMMGDTVSDGDVVRQSFQGVPGYYRNTAFWTWGTQPGWGEGNIRRLPATLQRMAAMSFHPRSQLTSPVVIEPEIPPVLPNKLQAELHPGTGLVQGNVTPGAEVDVEFFGNHVRTKAGDKPELGPGGFEVLVFGNPPVVTVAISGCEPLKVETHGQIPFITLAPVQSPVDMTLPTKFQLTQGFAKYATAHPELQLVADGPLEFTGITGDAIQRVRTGGNKRGFLVSYKNDELKDLIAFVTVE